VGLWLAGVRVPSPAPPTNFRSLLLVGWFGLENNLGLRWSWVDAWSNY